MVEIVQLIGGAELLAIASGHDVARIGDIARERAALYHLASDATSSDFARGQRRSEEASPGDSDHEANALNENDLKPLSQRISNFIERTD